MPAGQNLPSECRALVPLETPPDAGHRAPPPRIATFLAHLIATARQLPQTRERRCAEPHEAIAAYQATIAKLGGRKPQ